MLIDIIASNWAEVATMTCVIMLAGMAKAISKVGER